ncbi:MAG: rhamnogalacturonidase, partial [Bryobacteraceae bacterium]
GIYDVKDFGAKADGHTIDTAAINKAIAEASSAGGGTVRFPGGAYVSYSIHLKDNVTLYLESGATILAAADKSMGGTGEYDHAEPGPGNHYEDYGHRHWHNSLLWGVGLENIAILGPGRIWGKGLSKGYGPGPKQETPGVADKAIALKNCRNVLLRDFEILHGGHFGILATGVNNLAIDNLKIDTNRDGMDIDCCQNVRISNCSVNSPWDDAIVLKSSYALDKPVSTDMVTITDCLVSGSFDEGTLLDGTYKRYPPGTRHIGTGRIKLGTESNGGFRNIAISNCIFDGCQGLALETSDGALLEDVAITNITMRYITSAPIFLRLNRRMRGPTGRSIGVLKRVLISGLVCSHSASHIASVISGIPGHRIEDVKIDNVYIQTDGGGEPQPEPPELETSYPEPGHFHPMPAGAFFIRHVKNIEMSNVEIAYIKPDQRPAFYLHDVDGADFFRIKVPQINGVSAFDLNDVSDFSVGRSKPMPDTTIEHTSHKDV